ncbi:MAG: hypothetical protein WCL06_05715, partial [Bacteroidota bacterium]
VGDTLKFLSNHNRNRVYKVTDIQHSINKHDYDDSKYESIIINFDRIDTIAPQSWMNIVNGYPHHIDFLILCSWDNFKVSPFNLPFSNLVDTLHVNNIVYNNVIKLHFGDTINGIIDSLRLNTLYYQKEKGWLRFDNGCGEYWERIN